MSRTVKCKNCIRGEDDCPWPDMNFDPGEEIDCMDYLDQDILSQFTNCCDCEMSVLCLAHERNPNIIGCKDGRKKNELQRSNSVSETDPGNIRTGEQDV